MFEYLSAIGFFLLGCIHGDVRLLEGFGELDGRVEICVNNVWSRTCRTSWDNLEAKVICRQLGHTSIGKSYS